MAGEGIAAAKMRVRRGRKVRMVVRIVNFMMEVEVALVCLGVEDG